MSADPPAPQDDPSTPQGGRNAGTFDSERAKAAAAKRWEKARATAADAPQDAARGGRAGGGNGLVEPSGDETIAVETLRSIAQDKSATDAARVAASRALMERGVDASATDSTGLEHMSLVELADLALGMAGLPSPCPVGGEPTQGQG